MLIISIPEIDGFDEETQTFVSMPGGELHLEHNLIALSKWESITHKHLIGNEDITPEEMLLYIKCMITNEDYDPELLDRLPASEIERVSNYMADTKTATTFVKSGGESGSGEYTSSELIYYWMIACQIPFECEKWHINRLLTLIRVCNEKNQPEKKMSRSDILSRNRDLNRARRQALGSKG